MTDPVQSTETVEGSEKSTSLKFYFPELDGLRFFAFLLVYLFHQGVPGPLLRGLVGSTASRSVRENGWVGVQLFFILSGFLITTLLLREEAAYGRVDLKAFWVRRALRIWPLYYLTLALTFVVIPGFQGSLATAHGRASTWRQLPAFLVFGGNWSMIFQGPVAYDAQSILWSVCVEEQFYLFVPWIVAIVAPRFRAGLVVAGIVSAVLVRLWVSRAGLNPLWIHFNAFAQSDTLLSGVLLALCLGPEPRQTRLKDWLRGLQWPLYGLALWGMTRSNLGHGETWRRVWDFVAIWGVGVGLVAVVVTVPGKLRSALSHPRLVWLGKISYGLYMYHEIAFWLRDRLSERLGWFPNHEELLSVAAFGITVGLAALSYERFERPFLRFKIFWTRVPSRPV